MKKKALITVLSVACVAGCALGFAACDLFGGGDGDNKKYVVYHLNGGYYGSDSDDTDDHRAALYDNEKFIPSKAKKDTWLLENWYFNAELTEAYSDTRFAQLRAEKDEIDLYAKWIDEVTVTKDNFTEYFSVSSRWNGGGTIGNAGIYYSISPKLAYDPANSAENFDVEVTPVLTNNDAVVWRSETTTVTLTSEADYSCSYLRKIDSSAAGIYFDIGGRTLEYKLLTESFRMKLMHKVPVEITLDLGGGETDELTVNGSEKLLKSSLPEPEKDGYKFLGWYTDEEFENEYTDWVVTRPITLYAKIKKQITVTYHMNGAAEKEAETYLVSQSIYTGSNPEREGYKFFGYYKTENFAEGTKFSSGSKSDVDIDLYARWEKIRTITFVMNGATEQKEPIKIADTEIPDLGSTPSKGTLEFHGWYTDTACTQKFDDDAPISGDVTLYALWAERQSLGYSMENLEKYLDIELVDERIDGVLTLTLTVSIKEKYRDYEFALGGSWRVDLSDEANRNLGNGEFTNANGMALSTLNGKLTATGVYTADKGYANNDATVFKLRFNLSYGYVYIPESDLESEAE